MSLLIDVFICRKDNYGYLAHDPETGRTAAIDAPERFRDISLGRPQPA